jgi:hypothetical protein
VLSSMVVWMLVDLEGMHGTTIPVRCNDSFQFISHVHVILLISHSL